MHALWEHQRLILQHIPAATVYKMFGKSPTSHSEPRHSTSLQRRLYDHTSFMVIPSEVFMVST